MLEQNCFNKNNQTELFKNSWKFSDSLEAIEAVLTKKLCVSAAFWPKMAKGCSEAVISLQIKLARYSHTNRRKHYFNKRKKRRDNNRSYETIKTKQNHPWPLNIYVSATNRKERHKLIGYKAALPAHVSQSPSFLQGPEYWNQLS